ncbi:MAG: hypothetical protein IKU60_01775 [Clostridia bacterium]|nr:hypothetical protein [Clostridia bacterium]
MKKVMAGILSSMMLVSSFSAVFAEDSDVILHYDFENEFSGGTNYGATIKNGYAFFDGIDDYIHMPDNLTSGEEDVTFIINVRPEMDKANQFTFTVGTGDNNYIFLNTNNTKGECKSSITNVGYWNEYAIKVDPVQRGQWASIAVVMDNHDMKMYIGGEKVGETTSEVLISGLGDTNRNYLAKSQYSGDSYFKGYIEDFRIYGKALTNKEIAEISAQHAIDAKKADVAIVAENYMFESYSLTEDISLPEEYAGLKVTWKSDNERVLSHDGKVTRLDIDAWANLTATFTDSEGNKAERVFGFNIVHQYTDEEVAQMDLDAVFLVGNLKHLKEDLYLTEESKYGSKLRWESMDESVITNEGEIKRAKSGEGDRSTELYLFSTYNGKTVSKKYDITVKEEDYAYLFAYFTGNRPEQERMFYGLSRDGYNFNTINGGNSVLESTKGHECMRDPFIMQGQNGLYYAIFTDMRSWDGWSSQSSIIIFESEDLINWDEGTVIDFNQFGWYNRAWAPQAIWDPEFYDEETGEYGAYMIYLALSSGGATNMHKVYTKDMKTLITEPEILYMRQSDKSDIDSDIVYKDGVYYMYVKDESAGGIYVVESLHAGGPYSERINELPRKNKNGNNVAIEGSGIFKLMNEDKYNIVYDAYNDGFFIMTETTDMVNFTQLARSDYSFDFTPRHGYVITISKDEVDALEEKYGKSVRERIEAKKNPVIYYDFEDEYDKSGNFNDAQLADSATIAQGISGGQGLVLDGTSESYATIPSDALEGLEDYTVAVWIKPDVKNTTQRVFDFGTGSQRYMFLTPYYGKNVLRGAITAGGYTYEKGISIDADIETGRWTHLVMQQEGDIMRIYIDGVICGENENIKLDPYEIKHTIPYCYIGKSMFEADKYFDGTIDEFYLFDRAITEDEVTELYKKEMTIACNIGEDTVAFVRDGEDVEQFTAVIAQYDDEGVMVSAEKKIVDFARGDEVAFDYVKVGKTVRTYWFESWESLKPLE